VRRDARLGYAAAALADIGALALTVAAVPLVLADGLRAETDVPPSRRPLLPTT